MTTVLLVVHIMAAFSMIVLILLQRSEGGALGMGGGGGGFVTGRAAANLLTRITAVLAAIFFITSIALGVSATGPAPTSAVGGPGQNAPVPPPASPRRNAPRHQAHKQKAANPRLLPAQPAAAARNASEARNQRHTSATPALSPSQSQSGTPAQFGRAGLPLPLWNLVKVSALNAFLQERQPAGGRHARR